MQKEDKNKLIDNLKRALKAEESILFAYLFGSCVKMSRTKLSDTDVAVYTATRLDLHDRLGIIQRLIKATGLEDLDITFLNTLDNLMLLNRIFEEGIVILDRDTDFREYFEVMGHHKYLDFRYQRKLYLGV
jgi:predicted nucleotidyltransferase